MPAYMESGRPGSIPGSAGMTTSIHDQLQRGIEHPQHAVELVATLENQTGDRHDSVGTLAARQLGILLDTVDRHFRGSAEHREHRPILQEVDGVVAPLAGCDLTPI